MSLIVSGDSPSFSGTYQGGVITSGTAQVTTSGTAIDFTGIPSWVKRITVMFNGVSTNGVSLPLIQIGAGAVLTTGYSGSASQNGGSTVYVLYSSGFSIYSNNSAFYIYGQMVLTNVSGNVWCAMHSCGTTGTGYTLNGGGSVTLPGTLDRIRLTTVNGTDTFDTGSVNILYEG